jgi:hypothetical protein
MAMRLDHGTDELEEVQPSRADAGDAPPLEGLSP